MPAGNTYESIATQTLGSAAASVTFSSIPGTYTDLVMISNWGASTASEVIGIQFNADTGSNYSTTLLYGTGSSAVSIRRATDTQIYNAWSGSASGLTNYLFHNVQNYSNSTTFKTTLSREGTNNAEAGVGLWRNTAAITSMKILCGGGYNFVTGSTFSLYGIASA